MSYFRSYRFLVLNYYCNCVMMRFDLIGTYLLMDK